MPLLHWPPFSDCPFYSASESERSPARGCQHLPPQLLNYSLGLLSSSHCGLLAISWTCQARSASRPLHLFLLPKILPLQVSAQGSSDKSGLPWPRYIKWPSSTLSSLLSLLSHFLPLPSHSTDHHFSHYYFDFGGFVSLSLEYKLLKGWDFIFIIAISPVPIKGVVVKWMNEWVNASALVYSG